MFWHGFDMVLVYFPKCSGSFPEDCWKRMRPGGPELHEAQRLHHYIGIVLIWFGMVLVWFWYGFGMVLAWLWYGFDMF